MRTRDYKVVKYVKHHHKITKKDLYQKFSFLNDDYCYVEDCIKIENLEPELNDDGIPTGNWIVGESSTYRINHFGEELLEKRRHDAWLFWFPYAITTIIAIISSAPNVPKIFNYICCILHSVVCP